MKINDNNGFAHFMLLAFAILAVGIYGTYTAVSNTSQVASKTLSASAYLKKCPTPRPTLSKGVTSDCVSYVQSKLSVRPVDGVFGEKTQTAVEQYQARKKVTADGIVGPCTWSLLTGGGSASCKSSRVAARSAVDPMPIDKPTPTAKPSPRAADGQQTYCTYRDGDNTRVIKQPMTLGQCKALKGSSSSTPAKTVPAKITCGYTDKAGKASTKSLGNEKACEAFKRTNSYGSCDLQTGPNRRETQKQCASHKASSPTGVGTWSAL